MTNKEEVVVCSKCIYDTRVPKITFDEQGVCNYCKMIDKNILNS